MRVFSNATAGRVHIVCVYAMSSGRQFSYKNPPFVLFQGVCVELACVPVPRRLVDDFRIWWAVTAGKEPALHYAKVLHARTTTAIRTHIRTVNTKWWKVMHLVILNAVSATVCIISVYSTISNSSIQKMGYE